MDVSRLNGVPCIEVPAASVAGRLLAIGETSQTENAVASRGGATSMSVATKSPAKTAVREFEIVSTGTWLETERDLELRRNSEGLHARRWWGSYCWSPQFGCHVARWDTRLGFAYGMFDPVEQRVVKIVHSPRDAFDELRQTEDNQHHGTHIIDQRSQLELDYNRFVADYPGLAPELLRLGVKIERTSKLFATGEAHYPKRFMSLLDWAAYLRRHQSGDFGCAGIYSKCAPTLEERWLLSLQPQLLQNVVAIDSGSGTIKSQYELPDITAQLDHEFKRPRLYVTTVVSRRTLLWIASS
jgi:hypothetical protein